jgi:hypothetical protein
LPICHDPVLGFRSGAMGTTLTIEDAMRDPAPTRPVPFEGLPFDIEDLKIAMEWVAIRPSVRLCVATDHCTVQEALEICPSGGSSRAGASGAAMMDTYTSMIG